ncbi:zinc-binding dehydrogenase [Neokomagataea tanensis]
MILGHEVSGVVESLGTANAHFKIGDAVAIHPALPCGKCPECLRKAEHLCRHMRFFGSAALTPHTNGGFREHMTVNLSQLFKLPENLDLQTACLAEPLSVALHAIVRAGDVKGRNIMVQGAGPIGALIVAGLKVAGAKTIIATDLQDFPLETARHLGATATFNTAHSVHDNEYDIVFEATGVPKAFESAVKCTQKGGVLVQVGMFPPGEVSVPLSQIISREIDYRGTFRFNREFGNALTILSQNPWIASGLITQTFPLDKYSDAFKVCANRKISSKVLLEI